MSNGVLACKRGYFVKEGDLTGGAGETCGPLRGMYVWAKGQVSSVFPLQWRSVSWNEPQGDDLIFGSLQSAGAAEEETGLGRAAAAGG